MPEPEIARRCPSCGASIRVQAFFCPQCGKELKQKSEQKDPLATTDLSKTVVERRFDDTIPIVRITADESPPVPNKEPLPSPSTKLRGESDQRAVSSRLQRATTRARDVEGDVIQRVQKLRDISNVMMEEASYDPSLRFVLVAAALFALFLIIVILNKLIA